MANDSIANHEHKPCEISHTPGLYGYPHYANHFCREPVDSIASGEQISDAETDPVKSYQVMQEINKIDASDPTKFVERSFAVIWNEGHSIRLINREHKGAISIPWDDIDALVNILRGTRPAREVGNAAPIYHCNKCGYVGGKPEHEGCNYAAGASGNAAEGERTDGMVDMTIEEHLKMIESWVRGTDVRWMVRSAVLIHTNFIRAELRKDQMK